MKSLCKISGGAALLAVISGVPAFAADLYVPPEPGYAAPVAAPVNWGGFYVGILGGLGASTDSLSLDPDSGDSLGTIDFTGNGGLVGVRAGYDAAFGNFLLGASADLSLTNIGTEINGTFGTSPSDINFDVYSRLQDLGTVQARVGTTIDDLLVYAHGGWAWGTTEAAYEISGGGVGSTISDSDTEDRSGFVVGAGLQYKVTDNMSVSTEYSYYDLGSAEIARISGLSVNDSLTFHAITAGLNFNF